MLWVRSCLWFVEDVFMPSLERFFSLSFPKEMKRKSKQLGVVLDIWFWGSFLRLCFSLYLRLCSSLWMFKEQISILRKRFLPIWGKFYPKLEVLETLLKNLKKLMNITGHCIITLARKQIALYKKEKLIKNKGQLFYIHKKNIITQNIEIATIFTIKSLIFRIF